MAAFMENTNKVPWYRRLMCSVGIHDYVVFRWVDKKRGNKKPGSTKYKCTGQVCIAEYCKWCGKTNYRYLTTNVSR